ncbi:hypothetical protein [Noviherbaspirillum sp. ST9]|uniref:hypothetical protein n=1 Tax=Noviherbaspirillum sp. ST9 TaxID=3401606 RepID=UPI003B586E8B
MKKKQKLVEKNRIGICKLTQGSGTFVESHLIPKALTKPAQKGVPFFQLRADGPPIKRWNSWYDTELVTRAGEDILAEFDTWAINELRKHRLIWSSWGKDRSLGSHHRPIKETPWGIRKLDGIDSKKLRLFFLTLLWRAAATNLPEFSDVRLPQEDLERLRLMICNRIVEPVSFYPVQLTQLSTIGIIHNHAPICELKAIRSPAPDMPDRKMLVYRFYFDGLIAHIHAHSSDDGFTSELGNLIVGMENSLLVPTQTYENSYQSNRLILGLPNIALSTM